MRELALAGLVALVFGLGSFYATGDFGPFQRANLGLGATALLLALALGARRLRAAGTPPARRLLLRGALGVAAALALALLLESAAALSGIELDLTREGRSELAPATLETCNELAPRGLTATLFHDPQDPRLRGSRLLLRALARGCPLALRERVLEDDALEAERFEVTRSNSIVFQAGERFETVERPLEGAVYEALYRLRDRAAQPLLVLRGEGEGDPEDAREAGFSGLAAALATEGYRLESAVSALLEEVPEGIAGVLALAPRRQLPEPALAALRRYLAGGGRLAALLEPGRQTGLEELLGEWGLASPDAVVVDPESGRVDGRPRGLGVVASRYESHAVTRGLGKSRMTFFPGARAFRLRKPEPDDQLWSLVYASPDAWLGHDLAALAPGGGELAAPEGAPRDFYPIAVAGRYRRGGAETRILAFGDSEFASNRYLRSIYNLDLILNGVHWLLAREPEITLRPKLATAIQFPLPLTSTLTTLYGVGLLVPELLLIAGGLVWLRGRR